MLGRMAGRVGDPVKSCSSFKKEIKELGIQIAAYPSTAHSRGSSVPGRGKTFPRATGEAGGDTVRDQVSGAVLISSCRADLAHGWAF